MRLFNGLVFISTVLSGIGGLFAVLVWFQIGPKDIHVTIPHWGWLLLAMALNGLCIASAAYFGRMAVAAKRAIESRERAGIPVEILAPLGGPAKYREEVIGSAWPPDSPVQVLVYARDGKWHPQESVAFRGAMWTTTIWVGNPDSPVGSAYRVIAKTGGPEITTPVAQLPKEAVYSQEVRLIRADGPVLK